MRILPVVCLLLGTFAWGQANPASPDSTEKSRPATADDDDKEQGPPTPSTVAPDAAVLTIKGLCAGQPPKSDSDKTDASCQTVITRAQFERLSTAIQPNMPPQVKRQLASAYPRLLVMSRHAEERGLDKDAHFEEMIGFARVQILSQELVRSIQKDAEQVPEKDIEDYYHNNTANFETAALERILIPNLRQTETPEAKSGPASAKTLHEDAEKAMAKEAESLRTRAVAGEDFAKLQKEAYKAAGLTTDPPTTNLGKVRRTTLPPAHISAFDMKPGEVSPVLSDASGHYIYKLTGKDVETLDTAKPEIHTTLQNQRMRDMMQKVQESVTTDVNEAYFLSSPSGGPKSRPNSPSAPNGKSK